MPHELLTSSLTSASYHFTGDLSRHAKIDSSVNDLPSDSLVVVSWFALLLGASTLDTLIRQRTDFRALFRCAGGESGKMCQTTVTSHKRHLSGHHLSYAIEYPVSGRYITCKSCILLSEPPRLSLRLLQAKSHELLWLWKHFSWCLCEVGRFWVLETNFEV